MAEVKIQIVSQASEDLGIEGETIYLPYRFCESSFEGYWPSTDGVITFYVGCNSFICRDCEKNRKIFDDIIAMKRTMA